MSNVLSEPTEPSFAKVGIEGRIFDSVELVKSAEIFTVQTHDGHETTIVQRECDFFYYVLEGHGSFIIDGHSETCEPGQLIVVPKGRAFRYEGKLRMLVVSVPPWHEGQERTL